jgi:uncharacterized protein (TIGR03086 family)
MDLVTALAANFDHTGTVIAGVTADQWDDKTPCSEWDVRALAAHTLGVVDNMGRGARGESLLTSVNDVELGPDPAARFRAVAATTLSAWQAADLDAPIDFGAGPRPARVGLMINLLDTSTHTWDLAVATGQPAELPAGVAEAALDAARAVVVDDVRPVRGFDPAITPATDATPTQQLVAFLGRRP